MPVPRAIAKASDIDSCGLTLSELQELWLGAHPTTGSHFRSREELVAAWEAGRAVVMRLWGSHQTSDGVVGVRRRRSQAPRLRPRAQHLMARRRVFRIGAHR